MEARLKSVNVLRTWKKIKELKLGVPAQRQCQWSTMVMEESECSSTDAPTRKG